MGNEQLFGSRKCILDPDIDAFHFQCWSWLLRHTGGIEKFRQTQLVLPTPHYFPKTETEGHARAEHIFEHVRFHAGMLEWPVRLIAQQELQSQVSTYNFIQHGTRAAGTYSNHGNGGVITYDPGQGAVSLVATFAHELGHYLNNGFPGPPPGGWDLVEPATDVTAAFLGFGVFGANSAFHFTRTQDYEGQGWSTSRLGYITEDEWALNLAIFCGLAELDINPLKEHLKPHIFQVMKRAAKHIAKKETLSEILASV